MYASALLVGKSLVGFLFSPIGRGLMIAVVIFGAWAYLNHYIREDERERLRVDAMRHELAEANRLAEARERIADARQVQLDSATERMSELRKQVDDFNALVENCDGDECCGFSADESRRLRELNR